MFQSNLFKTPIRYGAIDIAILHMCITTIYTNTVTYFTNCDGVRVIYPLQNVLYTILYPKLYIIIHYTITCFKT